ncbi:restriction endonuclease subunit S [Cronobacter sakazakii]|uniref:restriction endonuclease subunit S n=1 Tax=Enterobacteriaceae TaxID=543 RepID=UPI0009788B41|nr:MULTISPECIES: restriction endonuclease subunit S [Enterobacteriaceae]EGH0620587.1 restriction endonuclease subunit S [Escherichia coli]EGT4388609.1 restriction endonuclease subunit S [Cronobacter sakazakii]EGT4392844.1 restriction endonuclease subunit S [Cronobacter sakazakii]EGT4395162.1 restriction endonuclease subunit S [Cronobacter sakazakii]EGT4406320.1 restriction endonuclease subunit S [Cronobacter sakazakii]
MSEMSYLEKLLDGVEVEWKTLEDISIKISSGGTPKTGVSEFYDGDIPWLRTQEVNFCDIWDTEVKITESGVKNSSAKWIPKNCVIVAMYGATVGKIGINKIPMTTNQACANIQLNEEVAHYRYVFHFLCSQYTYIKSLGTGSQTNINAQIVKNIKIPIPCPDNPEKSLAIQSEIVRILDKFTALTAELTAELTMRKKQYNYYRDQLLSFEQGEVEWKTLGEITTKIASGRNKTRDADGKFPVYGSTGLIGFIDKAAYSGDLLLVARVGAYAGLVNAVSGHFDVSDNTLIIHPSDSWNVRFAFHQLRHMNLNQYAVGAGQPLITGGLLKNLKVPFPSLKEQTRIAKILDKFETITASISEGLPREIELRQKQYEYYRDLLFSFPKPDAVSN